MEELRIGQGFDVHPLVEGRRFFLGGVEIPSPIGPLGHSDGDALLHALTDALLGATGKPDLGQRFKSSDPRWKDAPSRIFLEDVWREMSGEGWKIVNVDCSILLEHPKVASSLPMMRGVIASVLRCEESRVGVKATTSERLGFVGRGEGLLASAVVLLCR